jgi:transcriptional regulator GlxA family with amidase domain
MTFEFLEAWHFPVSSIPAHRDLPRDQQSLGRRDETETPIIRLQAARNILFEEEFSTKEVAVACSFSYPAVFSRAFRAQFKQTPCSARAISASIPYSRA